MKDKTRDVLKISTLILVMAVVAGITGVVGAHNDAEKVAPYKAQIARDHTDIKTLKQALAEVKKEHATCETSSHYYRLAVDDIVFEVNAHEKYGTEYDFTRFYADLDKARNGCDSTDPVVGSTS